MTTLFNAQHISRIRSIANGNVIRVELTFGDGASFMNIFDMADLFLSLEDLAASSGLEHEACVVDSRGLEVNINEFKE